MGYVGRMVDEIYRHQSPWSYCGALKKVQDEGDGTAVDTNEEVDT